VRQRIQLQKAYALNDAIHNTVCRARIIFGDPLEYTIKIMFRSAAENDLHLP
jgi:hypothetical protein